MTRTSQGPGPDGRTDGFQFAREQCAASKDSSPPSAMWVGGAAALPARALPPSFLLACLLAWGSLLPYATSLLLPEGDRVAQVTSGRLRSSPVVPVGVAPM